MNEVRARGRPRSFDRELGLLAAMECFWRLGYDGASVRQLAADMGISQPSLYLAYESKAQLFMEALKLYERRFSLMDMTPLTSAGSLEEGVIALFEGLGGRSTRDERGCMLLTGVVANLPEQRKLVLHLRGRRRVYQATLGVALKSWLEPHEASRAARVLIGGMTGYASLARDGSKTKELRDLVSGVNKSILVC